MIMNLQAGPAVRPLTLSDVYDHLRLQAEGTPPTHPEDALLESVIDAATAHMDGLEGMLGRALISQTWVLKLKSFPCRPLNLPLPPVQSIDSITYLDQNGVSQTLDSSVYVLVAGIRQASLHLAANKSWPATADHPEAVSITYTAGYGDTADAVPQPVKTAMLFLIANWYENREATTPANRYALPFAVEALISPYKSVKL